MDATCTTCGRHLDLVVWDGDQYVTYFLCDEHGRQHTVRVGDEIRTYAPAVPVVWDEPVTRARRRV